MTGSDLRWLQRFDNFQRALLVLGRGVRLAQTRQLSELEQQGLIQGFEFSHELAHDVITRFHPAFCALGEQFAALAAASR
jgi:hypothetical protein